MQTRKSELENRLQAVFDTLRTGGCGLKGREELVVSPRNYKYADDIISSLRSHYGNKLSVSRTRGRGRILKVELGEGQLQIIENRT